MEVSEKYTIDKARECSSVFRTTDGAHPGVADGHAAARSEPRRPGEGALRRRLQGEVRRALHDAGRDARASSSASAGPVSPRSRPAIRCIARTSIWRKSAIEVCDGVLVHSLLGTPQARRHPGRGAHARDRRADREVLPSRHRGAGGLSARHALRRAARSPAARALPAELRLLASHRRARPRRRRQLLRAVRRAPHLRRDPARVARDRSRSRSTSTFWCYRCDGMASGRTCPHDDEDQLQVSGTQLRKWLSEEGAEVPPEFSRPEVLEILRELLRGEAPAGGRAESFAKARSPQRAGRSGTAPSDRPPRNCASAAAAAGSAPAARAAAPSRR